MRGTTTSTQELGPDLIAKLIESTFTPEERHSVYKMLRLNAIMYRDGRVEITGAFTGLLDAMSSYSVKTESTSSSTATSQTSPRRGTGSHTAWR